MRERERERERKRERERERERKQFFPYTKRSIRPRLHVYLHEKHSERISSVDQWEVYFLHENKDLRSPENSTGRIR